MTKYFIGEIGFKTKKECENYTRIKISDIGRTEIRDDNENFQFFMDLIHNHPECEEKCGCGINYFFIQRNPLNSKANQTMIKRTDGTSTDFSWVYCCQFKPRSDKYNLTRAMRESISPQTIKFKQSQIKLICNICKSINEEYSNYHVDHNEPPFRVLRDTFLSHTDLNVPTSFGDCLKTNLTIFKNDDINFNNAWTSYHESNCSFQILCKTCNLKKH